MALTDEDASREVLSPGFLDHVAAQPSRTELPLAVSRGSAGALVVRAKLSALARTVANPLSASGRTMDCVAVGDDEVARR